MSFFGKPIEKIEKRNSVVKSQEKAEGSATRKSQESQSMFSATPAKVQDPNKPSPFIESPLLVEI